MKRFIIAFLVSTMAFSGMFYTVEKVFLKGPDEEYVRGKTINTENKNEEDVEELSFVLLGIDDGGLEAKRGVRSDTIMVINMNFETGGIKLLTIPRDTRVDVGGKMDKLNHAHSIGGVDMAMESINKFLDIDVDNYVRIDFEGVMKIVDAIGGVEMDVPVDMKYDDPTAKPELHINVKKGFQLLDGKNSHDVIRFRHNNGHDYYPGGYSREEVQQMWMRAFAKSALSPKNILRLPKIIETSINAVDTNVPFSKILEAGMKANKLNLESIEMATVPIVDGKKIHGVFYFLADEEEAKKIANDMFGDGSKLPIETSEEVSGKDNN